MLRSYGIKKNGIYSFELVGFTFVGAAPRIITDGFVMYRKEIRGGRYVIDYSPDNGLNWILAFVDLDPGEDNIVITVDSNPEGYRELVRGGAYVIDQELTPTGFAGTENIDWVEAYYTKPV